MMRKMKTGRLVAVTAAALCAANVLAMPTAAELKKTQPLVAELMAPSLDALKEAGAKEKAAARVKVGDASCAFAKEAETEAAKFMLLKGAVFYYANGGDYDKAGEALQTLKTEIKSVPPNVICEIVGKLGKVSESKAPKLYANYWLAKLQMRAAADAKKLAEPRSSVNQRRYAEDLAISKDWAAASPEFAKVNNAPLRKASDAGSDMKGFERGDFWWTYEPALENADNFFRLYAASLYKKQLAANEITGLKKNLVEKRLADLPAWMKYLLGSAIETASVPLSVASGPIGIKTGSGSPFTMKDGQLELGLENGQSLAFAACPKGRGVMLINYKTDERWPIEITRPFWILKAPLSKPKCFGVFKGEMFGNDYFECKYEHINEFCALLNEKYGKFLPKGYVFRLPSLAEYEYAFTAGCGNQKDPFSCVNSWLAGAKEIFVCDGGSRTNAWGIGEWPLHEKVLDQMREDGIAWNNDHGRIVALTKLKSNKDPLWWSNKIISSDADPKELCYMMRSMKNRTLGVGGFRYGRVRLVIGPDLVSEWKAKNGKSAAVSSPAPSSGKAWQEKGNSAWLDLGEKGKLEFVKCPAGSFKRLMNAETMARKPVRITRDFWIMKSYVTVKQASFMKGVADWNHRRRSVVMSLAEYITDAFSADLPNGLVLRLPTAAEWEYAFHANTHDRKSPWYDICPGAGDRKASFVDANGACKPNDWGFTINAGWELFLDLYTKQEITQSEWNKENLNEGKKVDHTKWWVSVLPEMESMNDPIAWTEDEKALDFLKAGLNKPWYAETTDKSWAQYRFVVGPDLVSEWKAKHGKK